MNPIEYETKSDRELLIQAVDKVNEIAKDIKSVCHRVDTVEDKVGINTTKIQVAENDIKAHSTQMKVITGFLVGTIGGLIASFLRHVGG